jgi:hypothetical protein
VPYKDPIVAKEHQKNYAHRWYLQNQEKEKKRVAEWKENNPDASKIWRKTYYEKHKEEIAKRHSKQVDEIRLQVLRHYGGNKPKCACCGETIILFLSIDHINNNGNKQRKALSGSKHAGTPFYRWLIKNNYPEGYQVLCMNCNWGRSRTPDKMCPHKTLNSLVPQVKL